MDDHAAFDQILRSFQNLENSLKGIAFNYKDSTSEEDKKYYEMAIQIYPSFFEIIAQYIETDSTEKRISLCQQFCETIYNQLCDLDSNCYEKNKAIIQSFPEYLKGVIQDNVKNGSILIRTSTRKKEIYLRKILQFNELDNIQSVFNVNDAVFFIFSCYQPKIEPTNEQRHHINYIYGLFKIFFSFHIQVLQIKSLIEKVTNLQNNEIQQAPENTESKPEENKEENTEKSESKQSSIPSSNEEGSSKTIVVGNKQFQIEDVEKMRNIFHSIPSELQNVIKDLIVNIVRESKL